MNELRNCAYCNNSNAVSLSNKTVKTSGCKYLVNVQPSETFKPKVLRPGTKKVDGKKSVCIASAHKLFRLSINRRSVSSTLLPRTVCNMWQCVKTATSCTHNVNSPERPDFGINGLCVPVYTGKHAANSIKILFETRLLYIGHVAAKVGLSGWSPCCPLFICETYLYLKYLVMYIKTCWPELTFHEKIGRQQILLSK